MSAAARKRNGLAVSRAQKKRWAAFRKAKKAAKALWKRRAKAKPVAPKPGTLEAKIVKVAGTGQG